MIIDFASGTTRILDRIYPEPSAAARSPLSQQLQQANQSAAGTPAQQTASGKTAGNFKQRFLAKFKQAKTGAPPAGASAGANRKNATPLAAAGSSAAAAMAAMPEPAPFTSSYDLLGFQARPPAPITELASSPQESEQQQRDLEKLGLGMAITVEDFNSLSWLQQNCSQANRSINQRLAEHQAQLGYTADAASPLDQALSRQAQHNHNIIDDLQQAIEQTRTHDQARKTLLCALIEEIKPELNHKEQWQQLQLEIAASPLRDYLEPTRLQAGQPQQHAEVNLLINEKSDFKTLDFTELRRQLSQWQAAEPHGLLSRSLQKLAPELNAVELKPLLPQIRQAVAQHTTLSEFGRDTLKAGLAREQIGKGLQAEITRMRALLPHDTPRLAGSKLLGKLWHGIKSRFLPYAKYQQRSAQLETAIIALNGLDLAHSDFSSQLEQQLSALRTQTASPAGSQFSQRIAQLITNTPR
jgi:hypothetical protein